MRPAKAFDHIKLKTDRAKEHLEALNLLLDAFRKDDPCTITGKDELEKARYIAKFQLKDPVDRTALLAGEFAFCLRSALDHIVFQLSLLGTKNPGNSCQFPISGRNPHTRFADYTRFIPDDAKRIVDSFQPYHLGDAFKDSLLWKLEKFCNIDKHRRLTVHSHGVYFKVPNLEDVRMDILDDGGIVDMPMAFKEDFKSQFKPGIIQCAIFFGDEMEGLSIQSPELLLIYEHVCNDVIPSFAGFFT